MGPLDSFEQRNRRAFTRTDDRQMPTPSLFCAGALLLGVAVAIAQTSGAPGNPSAGDVAEETQQKEDRLREGTELVDQPGTFRMTGDRITFFTELGRGRFVVLENLALERVGRAIEDNPQPLQWLVTGTITEFRGDNLLLIHRAVLRNRRSD